MSNWFHRWIWILYWSIQLLALASFSGNSWSDGSQSCPVAFALQMRRNWFGHRSRCGWSGWRWTEHGVLHQKIETTCSEYLHWSANLWLSTGIVINNYFQNIEFLKKCIFFLNSMSCQVNKIKNRKRFNFFIIKIQKQCHYLIPNFIKIYFMVRLMLRTMWSISPGIRTETLTILSTPSVWWSMKEQLLYNGRKVTQTGQTNILVKFFFIRKIFWKFFGVLFLTALIYFLSLLKLPLLTFHLIFAAS